MIQCKVIFTLRERVEFAHESAENERRFSEIVYQVRPHATKSDQNVGSSQIYLRKSFRINPPRC